MDRSRINNLTCGQMSSKILGVFLLLLINIIGYSPLSFAQSCSVTSMESGKAIRACQIEDMRTLINAARAACVYGAIPPYPFSDDPIVPNQTTVSRRHINEFATAVNEILTRCGPVRPTTTYRDIKEKDIISTGDFVTMYNEFIATDFCGDSICQTTYEDLATCPVDCGGSAQFYCNGVGGCYAAINCPSGKNCYPVLQDCIDNAVDDCSTCSPSCVGVATRKTCEYWDDGCGGLCWGTKDVTCACSSTTCVGSNCTDSCGNVCPGTKVPDLSCAGNTCIGKTCSDGCGGLVVGTAASTCNCASSTCVGSTCVDDCGVTCAGTKVPDCSCASSTCVGKFCAETCTGAMTCAGTKSPSCSCASSTPVGSTCSDGCGGTCAGTKTASCSCASSTCIGKTCSNGVGGTCAGTKSPSCSCASSTPIGSTCSDGCGGTCAGTATASCSCASKTCVGKSCSNGAGGTCAGTKQPSCSCASSTCIGDTCSNGCGGQCAGTKNCSFDPIECKKWSCSSNGFCQQNYTTTCSCPSGKKPICKRASKVSCGGGISCPDTQCQCIIS